MDNFVLELTNEPFYLFRVVNQYTRTRAVEKRVSTIQR